jgi:hypothetical protein
VRRNETANRFGAVVEDDQLRVVVVLAEKIADCFGYEAVPIVCRHDTGDIWHNRFPRSLFAESLTLKL